MSSLLPAQIALRTLASPIRAEISQRFFKTGVGEYGDGDQFLGVTVPQTRKVARAYRDMSLKEIQVLVESALHEDRLLGLLILVGQFQRAKIMEERKKILHVYLSLAHQGCVNNWDLVDTSAYHIVGAYVYEEPSNLLEKLAGSKNLWERRIAIVATFYFICHGQPEITFRIAKLLLADSHDLIHKAVGWMLREAGKRCSEKELEVFLKMHYQRMPRTMLRYAIERLPEVKRRAYLKGGI
ncbi:DNA alkylation repair protein [Patescibacteria group bacterium]|nr:DNA alkylation repair protein [Patescibacteria group bacterium]MBP9709607.1 DNA alkylation repair protein [Patescibacteria group bacterium]